MPSSELISTREIERRIEELAKQISRDYAGAGEIVLVGVLKGAFIFLSDLARKLTVPRRIEFIALSSYREGSRWSGVRLIMDLRTGIRDRHVLVVEDIVDSGRTLKYLLDMLRARGPASVESCAFVRKRREVEAEVDVRYVGFEIPDTWVVGYGLDYDEHFRALPYIAVLEPSGDADSGPGAAPEQR
ncbi:MAG: hypoxanthine phosphoribosyltransferase [Gemmatimonadota bacterium]